MVGKLVMRERRVLRILSCVSTPCDMQSFIVWMIAGIAERETARKAMRRWREPMEMVITLAFVVAHCATHEDGVKEVFCMPAICRDKVRFGITRMHTERNHVASQ
jgi:hypothetical protein